MVGGTASRNEPWSTPDKLPYRRSVIIQYLNFGEPTGPGDSKAVNRTLEREFCGGHQCVKVMANVRTITAEVPRPSPAPPSTARFGGRPKIRWMDKISPFSICALWA